VGAAVRTESGKIYNGCNVENSSYGGTVCAERVAIQKAVSEEGALKIVEVLVVTDSTPPWPPCGLCRQVIGEFCEPKTPIHSTNLKGDIVSSTLDDLLPNAFTSDFLSSGKSK
jgi:cytidine deaminase